MKVYRGKISELVVEARGANQVSISVAHIDPDDGRVITSQAHALDRAEAKGLVEYLLAFGFRPEGVVGQ